MAHLYNVGVREVAKFSNLRVSACDSVLLLKALQVVFIIHLLSKTDISNTCVKISKTDLKILQYKPKTG